MIIVGKGSVQEIADAITAAMLSATDHRGRQFTYKTVDPELLQRVALGALAAACGEAVMLAGTVLEVPVDEPLSWLRKVYPRG